MHNGVQLGSPPQPELNKFVLQSYKALDSTLRLTARGGTAHDRDGADRGGEGRRHEPGRRHQL